MSIQKVRRFLETEVDFGVVIISIAKEWKTFLLTLVVLLAATFAATFYLKPPYEAVVLVDSTRKATFVAHFNLINQGVSEAQFTQDVAIGIELVASGDNGVVAFNDLNLVQIDERGYFQIRLLLDRSDVEIGVINGLIRAADRVIASASSDLFSKALANEIKLQKIALNKALADFESLKEREDFEILKETALEQITQQQPVSDPINTALTNTDLLLALNSAYPLRLLSPSQLQELEQAVEVLTFAQYLDLEADWKGSATRSSIVSKLERLTLLKESLSDNFKLDWSAGVLLQPVAHSVVIEEYPIWRFSLFQLSAGISLLSSLAIAWLKSFFRPKARN